MFLLPENKRYSPIPEGLKPSGIFLFPHKSLLPRISSPIAYEGGIFMNPPAFVPLQEMKACAIFENPEFLRTLQHSILSDLFREGKLSASEYARSLQELQKP